MSLQPCHGVSLGGARGHGFPGRADCNCIQLQRVTYHQLHIAFRVRNAVAGSIERTQVSTVSDFMAFSPGVMTKVIITGPSLPATQTDYERYSSPVALCPAAFRSFF